MHRRVHLLATNVGAQAVGVLRTGPSGNGLGLIPTRQMTQPTDKEQAPPAPGAGELALHPLEMAMKP